MAKKGIRIRDLAKELGLTSRQLIDRCRAEGYPVQNSITKASPDLERRIRSWYAQNGISPAPVDQHEGEGRARRS